MGGLAAFGVQWAIRFRRVISPIGVEGVVFHRVLMGACHDGCLSLDLGPQCVFSHGEFGGCGVLWVFLMLFLRVQGLLWGSNFGSGIFKGVPRRGRVLLVLAIAVCGGQASMRRSLSQTWARNRT